MQLSGDKLFTNDGMYLDFSLSDFWGWYASNTLNGAIRGAIAEYIVAKSLDIDCESEPRQTWDAYDLEYEGIKIEVKSSAFIQSKHNDKYSRISFSIEKHSHWNKDERWEHKQRYSDIYVFCLFSTKDRNVADPMCIDQWQFMILPTSTINDKCGDQQSISLMSLLQLNPVICSYDTIKANIDKIKSLAL